jgi:hypothetical protein
MSGLSLKDPESFVEVVPIDIPESEFAVTGMSDFKEWIKVDKIGRLIVFDNKTCRKLALDISNPECKDKQTAAIAAMIVSLLEQVASKFDGDEVIRSAEVASSIRGFALQEVPAKKLVSILEHNQSRSSSRDDRKFTGVACPECGAELFYSNPDVVLTSDPPQKSVSCSCLYRGTILA